ncbi:MAG: 2,3-bisphosphoglycerate-independent phosphoglycerate mutase [Firmicutes bacterium]|nr:2,3-bisphosphoglycerate-independent phosphoglycerate mutase [Bacillota bacterium]
MTTNTKKPAMLMILDGYGLNPSAHGNAVAAADTPNLDAIFAKYPNVQLNASGLAVGLPEGQMGNSEVGHLNIGAGRIVYQELTKITKAIEDGVFFGNAALNSACDHVLTNGSALHVYGLMSDGGVHSHIEHIKAVLRLAKQRGLEKVYLHCFMDGRDVPPTSGIEYIKEIEDYMAGLGLGKVGVVSGRYYAMDRDKRWERLVIAYDALTAGAGRKAASGAEAVQAAYDNGETDEFIVPTVCCEDARIQDNDAVIFCNFRPDRAREITRAFVDSEFDSYGFQRQIRPSNLKYICMTQYDAEMPGIEVAFPPRRIENTLGEYISGLGLNQLRIAETEKYAHVTFFFNGGVEAANPLEDRILIPSPKVATYDLQPEMSAPEVTAKVLEEIESSKYDVIILNFANADMVGHTGVFDAAVKAVETLDTCVQQIADAILAAGGQILLTADHGNADNMLDEDGAVVTAHSTNPVPLVHIAAEPAQFTAAAQSGQGKLADIAPTMLTLMGLAVPAELDGAVLVKL